MKILVIGGGAREHAIAWKVAQSTLVTGVYVAPGNAGTAAEPGVENLAIDAEDIPALVAFAGTNRIALTIVGPEAPLVNGIVDRFRECDLACLGPTQRAAELEGSKAFAKGFCTRHGIATADYAVYHDLDAAQGYIRRCGAPLVVKADGLAAGKGVVVAHDTETALEAAAAALSGGSGQPIVIEALLEGEEASFTALVDGETVLPLATSQDHKPVNDGDRGANTGGMGAYSPAPVVTPALYRHIVSAIVEPTVAGLRAEGRAFSGFLYVGLMITPSGKPYVLEYNARLGDPEAEPLLMRLESDFAALCQAGATGGLAGITARWRERVALGVVLASGGYPGAYERGYVISGLDSPVDADAKVFHAATTRADAGNTVTSGGRVLCVCAMGTDTAAAQASAYSAVSGIHWQGVHYRTDIGRRALATTYD